jgi:hypothetical protein
MKAFGINSVAIVCASCLWLSETGAAQDIPPGCAADCAPVGKVDGVVGIDDLFGVILGWGNGGPCDINGDEVVDIDDLVEVIANWGLICPDPNALGACCIPTIPGGICTLMTREMCFKNGGAAWVKDDQCADDDADGIPNVFELDDCNSPDIDECYSGTDPNDDDTDDDGIKDGDEFFGTADGLQLRGFGADPCHKDLFLECDWLGVDGADDTVPEERDRNKPNQNQIDRVVAAFASAPVNNPDGMTGIAMHVDVGDFGGGDYAGNDSLLNTVENPMDPGNFVNDEFNTVKTNNFDVNRDGYFYYMISCEQYSFDGTATDSSGIAELSGNDFIVAVGQYFTDPAQPGLPVGNGASTDSNIVGNTLMHELGHCLSLRHGGDVDSNYKPNYNSIMNYRYQFDGVDVDDDSCGDDGAPDYSQNVLPDLDENNLDENDGVTGAGPGIDWSGNGDATDAGVERNINCSKYNNAILTTICDSRVVYFYAECDDGQVAANGTFDCIMAQAVADCCADRENDAEAYCMKVGSTLDVNSIQCFLVSTCDLGADEDADYACDVLGGHNDWQEVECCGFAGLTQQGLAPPPWSPCMNAHLIRAYLRPRK